MLPAIFNLCDLGHVGHGAPGIEVGENGDLAGAGKNVGAFGHEVHAAENDVFAAGLGGFFRELVGIAAEIGEADDFIALVMVSEDDHVAAEDLAGCANAVVHGVVGEDEIVLQTANCGSSSHVDSLSAPNGAACAQRTRGRGLDPERGC